ncbi:MAG: diguanylate cyclase domain-containing protein [Clostridia bacterium]
MAKRKSARREDDDLRRFRLAMDATADMITLIDRASMRYIDVNRPICQMLGYSHEELLAKGPADLVDRPRADLEREYDALIDNPAASSAIRTAYRCKDGSLLPIESIRRVYRSDERWIIVAISRDIRAQLAAEEALRDSEARFRSLLELSSDWYWEQDAELRYVPTGMAPDARGGITPDAHIGKRRWELPDTEIVGQTWDEHKALIAARRPFRNVVLRRIIDGEAHYVSVSGEPIFSRDGAFRGYRGVANDVTDRMRGQQLLRLEYQIARALSESEDEASGLEAVMRAICENQDFESGRYFRLDERDGRLHFQQGWGASAAGRELVESLRGLRYAPGEGLNGLVLRTGEPVWSSDTALDPRAREKGLGRALGPHGVLLFAVVSDGRRIGTLGFSSRRLRAPDERLLEVTSVIGSQVGQFLERKHAEAALRESESRFRSLTHMSSDFFWETDPEHRATEVVHGPNVPANLFAGAIGKAPWDIPSLAPGEAGWAAHRAVMDEHRPFRDFEFARCLGDGSVRHFSISGEPRYGRDGRFLGYRGVGRDITEVALARERVASLAYNDPLTGLANRTSLGPALEQAVERARRRSVRLATMFVDLDGFKQVNDRHGHQAGDRFLAEIARRLRNALRASDLVARLGGDEFFVVLEDQQESESVETVARKLLGELRRPVEVAPGEQASVSASIGISAFPDDATDAATLVKHADEAMYRAKQAGKNEFRLYGELETTAKAEVRKAG